MATVAVSTIKSSSIKARPIHLFGYFHCSVYRLATMYRVTDRRTDGATDDIIMYHANILSLRQSACSTIGSKSAQSRAFRYTYYPYVLWRM